MSKYEDTLKGYTTSFNEEQVTKKVNSLLDKANDHNTPEVWNFIYSCIDQTSLNTEDNKESIWKFTEKINDFEGSQSNMNNVAAVCVYPNFVATVKEALTADVKIAAVAGGFPSGQTFIEVKIAETALAVANGADEIDMVLNVGDFLEGNYEDLCDEIEEVKLSCRDACLKVILETGLLKTSENMKKAAILAMYSGADFVKTSTGKGYTGATPEAVYILCEAIKEYNGKHNRKIGIKVSGGVRTPEDAVRYYTIVKEVLGKEWLTPALFRIGASSLSEAILTKLEVK